MAGFGFGHAFSRRSHFPYGSSSNPLLTPGANWDGTASSGFTTIPTAPNRSTAKPVCRMLEPPRQTVTSAMTIGVFAAANNSGSLFTNLGLSHVIFHCEGGMAQVDEPSLRTYLRPDGSSYSVLGWWATLTKPAATDGLANVYVEAVPSDNSMQSRIIGPHTFVMADIEYDVDVTVASGGGADFNSMASAFSFLRSLGAEHPRITISQPGTYELKAGGVHFGEGYCTIEATGPVTFAQTPPTLPFDFTRMRPQYDRLRFKGSNITIDFVETLEFYSESTARQHWLDGCNLIQSRGRDDLWRGRPRNIIPSLFRGGAYFTDCAIQDVNDWGDKAIIARGNVTSSTWSDALQDADCAIANTMIDHSSFPYYQNIDALTLQYSGAASTATISLSGANSANSRSITLKENGASVATFAILGTEQAFRDDTNYSVQNVVDFINSQPDWSATLIDDTRFASALTSPGSANGSGFIDLDAKSAPLTLPTHFDIHSDLYQLTNLSATKENVVFAFNQGWQIDAQNMLISGSGGIEDAMFIGNAFYNNMGTPDEALATQLDENHSHVVFAHNSLSSQRVLVRQDKGYDGDIYCLIANNAAKGMTVSGGGAIDSDVALICNHIHAGQIAPLGGIDTSIGGDDTTLYVDAIGGNFDPAGDLLSNLKTPVIAQDLSGVLRADPSAAGAVS